MSIVLRVRKEREREKGSRQKTSSKRKLKVKVLIDQSCPTLCDPIDYRLPGSSVHGILQARITCVGCHFLLQGIFPTQALNLGFQHCRQIIYHLSHQRSLEIELMSNNYTTYICIQMLGLLITDPEACLSKMIKVLIIYTMSIILWCTYIWSQHIVQLKFIQYVYQKFFKIRSK